MKNKENIGENIKKYRELRGISRKKLGELIDRSQYSIKKYELNEVTPSLDIIKEIENALNIPPQTIFGKKSKKESYFKFDSILNFTYDIFEEIYNHSNVKDEIGISAKEFMEKDKYFIDELANNFYQTVFVKINALKERIVNKDDKTPLDNSINIKYAPDNKEKDNNDIIVTSTGPTFELGNKLNNKKYLEYEIKEYENYLKNIEDVEGWEKYLKNKIIEYEIELDNIESVGESKDNYELIEEELEEARKKYNKNQNNKKDNNIREANQEDIDNFFDR